MHNQPRELPPYEDCQAKSIQELGWTSQGMDWGWGQEPPHTDVSRNLATVVIRGVLPGLRRRRSGLLLSGPKSSFHVRASFGFHLETKVLESAGVGPLCFLKTIVTAPVYQEILEHYMLPSADQLFKDADFIFQQDWAEGHCQETWASIPPQQCHKLITSMSKVLSTYTENEHTFQKANNSQIFYFILLVLWSILICWDSELVGFC